MTAKLKQSEKKLNKINQYALQSVYLVTEGKTLNEALINNEKLVTEIEKLAGKKYCKKIFRRFFSDHFRFFAKKQELKNGNNTGQQKKKQSLLAHCIKKEPL